MDESSVYLQDKVLKSLQHGIAKTKGNILGYLFGLFRDTELYVHGYFSSSDTDHRHLEEEFDKAAGFLPGGLQPCGIFFKTQHAGIPKIVSSLCQKLLPSKSILSECFAMDTVLVMTADTTASSCHFYWFSFEKQDMWPAKVASVDDCHFAKSLVLFRIQAYLPLSFELQDQQAGRLSQLLSEMQYLEDRVQGSAAVFHIVDAACAPLIRNADDVSDTVEMTISEMLESVPVQRIDDSFGEPRSRKQASPMVDSCQRLVNVRLSFLSTGPIAATNSVACAPVIHHEHKQFKFVKLGLPLDVLVYVPFDLSVSCLSSLLVEGVIRQLRAMADCISKYSQDANYVIPKPFHFRLDGLNHLVTAVFPESFSDPILEAARYALHCQFLVATDRPVFRKANAIKFADDQSTDVGYLLDVHLGLPPSRVSDGKSYIVSGHYAYHHYLQDKVDDSGWGCAYRSLQTIVSWFRLQGYMDKPVPSHSEIQQALVAVGDKPPAFVGSKKWIGSTEVSYVLSQLYGIMCKILHVPSGAEIATKARELARHFTTQGTPIMIGGGVLAHTILGIDWNEGTGEVKFLILDPHYTGAEDLKFIQDKGWCGWKAVDFWDKNAYYNMCLPQRPAVF
jgi:hypothetical protein